MADINDNTINITISAPSADSNTISVVNPGLKNNVVVNDARITPSERAKLAGIEAGADETNSANVLAAGAVMTTGDQTIEGVKTFSGSGNGITIDNQANVNFNQSTTIFGTSAEVRFEGIDPQFKTDSVRFNGSGPQLLKKEGSGGFNIQNQGGGNLTITNAAAGSMPGILKVTNLAEGNVEVKASTGDLILQSGQGALDKVKVQSRNGIEFTLSDDGQGGGVNVDSLFKISDANPFAGDGGGDRFVVDRTGEINIKDVDGNEVFKVAVKQTADAEDTRLDFIRVGGEGGYKFPNPANKGTGKFLKLGTAESDGTIPMDFVDAVSNVTDLDDAPSDLSGQAGKVLVVNTEEDAFELVDQSVPVGALENVSEDSNPELGGNLDVVDFSIVSSSNKDINISPNGTGSVVINTDLDVDNININGNSISSTDTNGDVNISPNGTGSVIINTDLDVDNININGNSITSTDINGDITISPNGTGDVNIGSLTFDADQTIGASEDDYVLTYNHNGGNGYISLEETASTVTQLDDLSDVDLTGASTDDVLMRDSSGNFVTIDAFTAFMNSAVSASAGMPQSGSVVGDFDNDGLVGVSDLLIFLGNYGLSAFNGNTQIEFTDMTPSLSSVFNSNFTYDNYNTQTSITTGIRDMQQYELEGADVTTSIAPYTWQVSTSSDSIKLYTSNSTQFGEWFETANVELKNPSSIYHNVGDNSLPVSFAVYVEILREYPTAANETEVKMIADYTSVENLNFLIEQDEVVSFADAFKKDSGNTERPKAVTFKFYFAVADDAWGYVSHRFNNLKLKVTGPV